MTRRLSEEELAAIVDRYLEQTAAGEPVEVEAFLADAVGDDVDAADVSELRRRLLAVESLRMLAADKNAMPACRSLHAHVCKRIQMVVPALTQF